MKIDGDTVIFKSASVFYQKEQKGIKPNTVRILSQPEEEQLYKAKDQLKTIRIISTETGDSFERGITDITPAVLSNECRVFVISWHHLHFYNDLERKGIIEVRK
jgi:hypothetical protein